MCSARNNRKVSESIKDAMKKYIKEFGEVTTLHGFRYLVTNKIHWTETLVWAVAILLAITGSVISIYNNWIRYNTNPTVISLQKNYRMWKLPFPAATVCFVDKLNETLAKEFIYKNWKEVNETNVDYYMNFISDVVNSKYGTGYRLLKYQNDDTLKHSDLAKISHEVLLNITYHATIFDPKYNNINFIETLTEMGMCYTYSGVLAQYFTFKSDSKINHKFSPPRCNFLNSLCYARIEDLPANLTYSIHSPYEMPDIRFKQFIVKSNMERDTTFRFLKTIASKELRSLRPEQRKCRFSNEPLKKWKIQRYSYNLCLMECRRLLAYELCGCSPHIYKKQDDIPTCDLVGLACLLPYREEIITLKLKGQSVKCDCLPTCQDLHLYVDRDASREWTYPVPSNIRFRYAIEIYSKSQLKREVIFGIEDLLVSLGGTTALFLGCSLLSFVEILYFCTLRLFWYINAHRMT